MGTVCNFCSRVFNTHQGLSSHYKAHKDLSIEEWLAKGPPRSKILAAQLKLRDLQRQLEEDNASKAPMSPGPLRAVKWMSPNTYVELPWLTLDPEADHGLVRPPGPIGLNLASGSGYGSGDQVGKRRPMLDLNFPPPAEMD